MKFLCFCIVMTLFTGTFAGEICEAENTYTDGKIMCTDKDNTESLMLTDDIKQYPKKSDSDLSCYRNSRLIYKFREATEELDECIDVSDYFIKEEDIGKIYEMLVMSSPVSYYLTADDGSYTYYYDSYMSDEGCMVGNICPVYNLDIYDEYGSIDQNKVDAVMPELQENFEFINSELEKITDSVIPGSDTTEKLIEIHNYICSNYSYNYTEDGEGRKNTAYLMLRDKEGQCEAYASLFNYAAMALGLDTGFVISRYSDGSEYHMWNLIKNDVPVSDEGKWYHVDVTSDDTSGNGLGNISMKYFLLGDEEMRKTHDNIHIGDQVVSYGKLDVETDEYLDNAPWHDAVSQVEIADKQWYFMKSDGSGDVSLCSVPDADPAEDESEIYSFSDRWYADSSSGTYYTGVYTGLGELNGKLYFNGSNCVYAYNIKNGTVEKQTIDTDKQIFSCGIKNGCLYYGVNSGNADDLNIVEGGDIKLSDYNISGGVLEGNIMHFKVEAEDAEHELCFYVKDDEGMRCIEYDPSEGKEVDIYISSPQSYGVFLWDENMKPYTDPFISE